MSIRRILGKEKVINPLFRHIPVEDWRRIVKEKRYTPGETTLHGKKFRYSDAETFLSSLDEIFIREIYKLPSIIEEKPTMIDCGANIGLATLYFKKLFPYAKVLAYEADPNICSILNENISSQGLKDVFARNEAVTVNQGSINFIMEGGHSGMITSLAHSESVAQVKAVKLSEEIMKLDSVTFLKIDIEGHEDKVIPSIADQLHKVSYMFFEYHSKQSEMQELHELLSVVNKAGMRYYIKESTNKSHPFIDREIFLDMDLILNVFCYRF